MRHGNGYGIMISISPEVSVALTRSSVKLFNFVNIYLYNGATNLSYINLLSPFFSSNTVHDRACTSTFKGLEVMRAKRSR